MGQVNHRELDPVLEAIRFAEEYGYNNWQAARDTYNKVVDEMHEASHAADHLASEVLDLQDSVTAMEAKIVILALGITELRERK